MSRIIEIYLDPDQESAASEQEVADYIGVTIHTLRDRLKKLGPDHYLTYFPGTIPTKLRRFPRRGGKDSKLGAIKVVNRETVDPYYARSVVLGLVRISQKHYKASRCQDSKDFLLNKGGMLEWYLEAYPGIDSEDFLKRMEKWVDMN